MSPSLHDACPRRRVRQLSSVRTWCQSTGLDLPDSDAHLASYESFPDLRRLLEEECAEIERRELEAKAELAARRNSGSLSDASSASGCHTPPAADTPPLIASLYRLLPALATPALATPAPRSP
ncbi:hypothetical protein GGF46_003144 [Coemansia sp. RSA 552]|nr:hypothetical protein GGF46_003144 [Coemansia sp. RSA 552]